MNNIRVIVICLALLLGYSTFVNVEYELENSLNSQVHTLLGVHKVSRTDVTIKIGIIDIDIPFNEQLPYIKSWNIVDENIVSHGALVTSLMVDNIEQYDLKSNVDLYAYSIGSNEMSLDNLVKGLKTLNAYQLDIINLCLSTCEESSELLEVMNDLIKSGTVVVCSAGNSPYTKSYPSSYDINGIISVGALDLNSNVLESSYAGTEVDVYTYGEEIEIISGDSGDIYNKTGTSFAAPFVTVVCSDIIIKNRSTPQETEEIIINNSLKIFTAWRHEKIYINRLRYF